MKMQKTYFRLTLVISLLFGIILPLIVGVKNPTLLAIFFSSIWFIYAVTGFISTFLVRPGLKIKIFRHKNPIIVRFELSDPKRNKGRP